jgi:hypothetical protein
MKYIEFKIGIDLPDSFNLEDAPDHSKLPEDLARFVSEAFIKGANGWDGRDKVIYRTISPLSYGDDPKNYLKLRVVYPPLKVARPIDDD